MEREERDKIYSKRVRAGKRTYFFDVRTTRSNDYYLTVTESRRYQRDGDFVYEKSKMFIYKEDFNKFVEALEETVNHIKTELLPDFDFDLTHTPTDSVNEPKNQTLVEDAGSEFDNSELKWE